MGKIKIKVIETKFYVRRLLKIIHKGQDAAVLRDCVMTLKILFAKNLLMVI